MPIKVLASLMLILSTTLAYAVPAYTFHLIDERNPDRPFIAEISKNNPEGIASIEAYLTNGQVTLDEEGNPAIGILIGPVQRVRPSSQHAWKFRVDPSKIHFADLTIELCDGSFSYVEENLDEWIRDVEVYCPWSTRRLVKEIRKGKQIIFYRP